LKFKIDYFFGSDCFQTIIEPSIGLRLSCPVQGVLYLIAAVGVNSNVGGNEVIF